MLFTDSRFLLRFLPSLLALFFLALAATPKSWREGTRRFSLANTVLLAGSIVFLISGAGVFIRLIAALVGFNYAVAWAIGWARQSTSSARNTPLPEALLTLALTGNVVLFGLYKFAVPLSGDLDRFAERSFAVPHLLAPLGLTIVTCHAISYVVDVYRGQTPHQASPIRSSLYLVFFPLLCAGPLVRYADMGPQLAERRVPPSSMIGKTAERSQRYRESPSRRSRWCTASASAAVVRSRSAPTFATRRTTRCSRFRRDVSASDTRPGDSRI